MQETTDATFHHDVLASPTPVLVMFSATWCAPCRAMTPHLEKMADEFGGKLTVVKADVQRTAQAATMSGATMSVPTFVLFRGGVVVDGRSGACTAATLREMLAKHGVTT